MHNVKIQLQISNIIFDIKWLIDYFFSFSCISWFTKSKSTKIYNKIRFVFVNFFFSIETKFYFILFRPVSIFSFFPRGEGR